MATGRMLEPSLGTITSVISRHKLMVAACTVLGLGVLLVVYLLLTPVYEASTTLLVGQSVSGDSSESSKRPVEVVTSQARIAESDEVIRAAIERVGLDKLDIPTPSESLGLGGRLRTWFWGGRAGKPGSISAIDVAAAYLSRSLSVRTEINSDVLKIVFRHPDPVIAAAFANAVAQAFIDRQLKLLDRPGAVKFFRLQASRFDEEVEQRSAALEAFVRKEKTYSVEDQRRLLLGRASELQSALTSARGLLADKQGQKSALVSQLRLLKPVTQSPFVSTLVDQLARDEDRTSRPAAPVDRPTTATSDPPLLMVKVYQDAMVVLFRINSEIAGLQELSGQQESESRTINGQLVALAGVEAEFARLKRDVTLASYNADLYAKRTLQEQIDAELRSAKLSSVRVIQSALVPLRAAFPRGWQFASVGLILGIAAGVLIAFVLEAFRSHDAEKIPIGGAGSISGPRDASVTRVQNTSIPSIYDVDARRERASS